jgi:hypothetical protein
MRLSEPLAHPLRIKTRHPHGEYRVLVLAGLARFVSEAGAQRLRATIDLEG